LGRVAVDTNVLILGATGGLLSADDPDYPRFVSAKLVFDEANEIVVPAPAWFEVIRGATATERRALAGLRQRLHIEPLDAAAAERGAEIVRDAVAGPVCPGCYNPVAGTECQACGNRRAKSELVVDSMIAAIAELQRCGVLYTFDGNMQKILGGVARIAVRPPPEPPRLPLFTVAAEAEADADEEVAGQGGDVG